MKRIASLILVYSFVIFSNAVAKDVVNLQLPWKHQFQFAGYYIAKERGYYRKSDLEVNIKEFDNSIKLVEDVLSQKTEFGVGRSSLIYERLEGKPVVMLASIFQHSPVVLMTKDREDIKEVYDLRGKNIMLLKNHLGAASINAMLLSSGISQGEYKIKPHSFNIQDLIDGNTDAILAYTSNEPFEMEQRGEAYKIFSPKSYGFDFYSDILFTSQSYIDKKPDIVRKFRQATLYGWQYAMRHQKEAIDLILKKYNTQNKTKKALKFEAEAMLKLIDNEHYKLGQISKKRVDAIAQAYRLMGFVKHNFSLENLIYSLDDKSDITNSFNVNNFFEKIIPVVTIPIYNIDTDNLPSLLAQLLKENKDVKAIKIKESIDNSEIFSYYKDEKKTPIFNSQIPQKYMQELEATEEINYEDEKIAEISVYYSTPQSTLKLSKEEKKWIKSHPIIKFTGDPDWLPFEAFDINGKYIGVVSEYLDILEKSTRLKFNRIVTSSWAESVALSENKDVDMLSASIGLDRKNVIFTKPYIKNDIVIIMNKNYDYVLNLEEIKTKKIALVDSYGSTNQIKKKYPDINFLSVKSVPEGLKAVASGEIDAFVCSFALGSYKITKMGLGNIKIVGKTEFNIDLSFAVREDYAPLLSILNKALAAIPQEKHSEIMNHWIQQDYVEKIDYSLLYKVGGGALVFILMFIFWNRKMAKEIKKRKQVEKEVKESQDRFSSMVSNIPGVIYRCLLDEHWTILFISDEIENLSGYPASDFLNNSVRTSTEIIHPDDIERVLKYIQEQIANKKSYKIDYRIINKNSEVRWVRSEGKALYTEENSVGWLDGVIFDITNQKELQKEIEAINKHTRESIEYASLIQGALIPDNNLLRNHFQDYFAIWHPKDIVGGDIYLFEELRDKDECLLMVIDCTGHGVPGAFVTMLVKAIERQIIAKINTSDEVVSPANILGIFNKSMKHLLKQEDEDSISNAGFDGAIIYYNKKENILKFAGAETPLFILEDEDLKVIKGDRYSVGYKKCAMDHEYKEHTIQTKKDMQFYVTTDGYLDQNGGEKGFPFGKKRFQNIIKDYHKETMADQQEVFLMELDNYQAGEETNDDITLIGLKI